MAELTELQKLNQERTRANQLLAEEEALRAREHAQADNHIKKMERELEILQRANAEWQKRLTTEKQNYIMGETSEKTYRVRAEAIEKEIEITEKGSEALVERIKALQKLKTVTDQNFQRLTRLSSQWKNTTVGAFALAAAISGAGPAFHEHAQAMRANLSATELLGKAYYALAEGTIRMAAAEYDSLVLFNRATGATGEYNNEILSLARSTRHLGVTSQEVTASYRALVTQFGQFQSLSQESRELLGRTNVLLTQYGVNAEVAARTTNLLWYTTRQSAAGVNTELLKLISIGEQLDIGASRMLSEFNQALTVLGQWGDLAVEKFAEVQAVFKATGIEASRLISIADQFSTFAGAAQAAGRLNAILGGPLVNSLDLLNASEAERIMLLRESLALTNQSWEDMGRFQRRSVANAIGITDMGEATRLFNASLADMHAEQQRLENDFFMNPQLLEERSQQYQTLRESAEALFLSFGVGIQSVLEPIMGFVKWLAEINEKFPGILLGFALLNKLTGGLAVRLTGKLLGGLTSLASGLFSVGSAAPAAGGGMAGAAPGVAAMGTAMLPMAASVGIIAAGIGLMAGALALLFSQVSGNVDEFGMFALHMVSLSGALALMGVISPAILLGLTALAGGLSVLGLSLLLISTRDIEALGFMFGSLSQISGATASNLGAVAAAIRETALAASEIDFPTAVRFGAVVEGLGEIGPALAEITPETPRLTREIMDQVDRYYSIRAESGGLPREELTELIQALRSGRSPGGAQGGSRTVELSLDGEVLGRFVLDTVNDHIDLAAAV